MMTYTSNNPLHVPHCHINNRCVVMCVAGAVEVRKEGLEAQINRLADLIGRLENKVSSTHSGLVIFRSILFAYLTSIFTAHLST